MLTALRLRSRAGVKLGVNAGSDRGRGDSGEDIGVRMVLKGIAVRCVMVIMYGGTSCGGN